MPQRPIHTDSHRRAFFAATGGMALALAALLAGCGGGGGGGDSAPPPVQPLPPVAEVPPLSSQCQSNSVARLAQPATLQAGRNQELSLLACPGHRLSQLRWEQKEGATLATLSARSQALTLEPSAAGSHRFDLSYQDELGRSHSASLPLTVTADANPAALRAVLRGEPSVYAGGKFSLRAWLPGLSDTELATASWRWEQLEGPTLSLSGASGARLLATAPAASSDTLLRLRASADLGDGRSASGEFSLLVQALPPLPANPLFGSDETPSRVYPHKAGSPWAGALSECVYHPGLSSSSPNNLCTLGKLPLLGSASSTGTPTVDEIMDRVLVSNDWMGANFERFLREQDVHGDFRRMLASVTAVVIGGRVRPAFYWSATGAIYLDAANLWLTPEQRDTVSETPDPRSDNGAALSFASPWRYVKDNRHAITSLAVAKRASRSLEDVQNALGSLLYHELSHAGDFLPPRVHASLLGSSKRVYEAIPALTASEQLNQRYPFFSLEMRGLARVLSYGDAPTATQLAYRPEDVVRFFSQDRVNDDYSYSVASGAAFSREDTAMLIEEALMQRRLGVWRDYAITNKLEAGANSADLTVVWGQRGRIGEAAIRPRLQLVLAEIMPWLPADFADGLGTPLALRPGSSWGANLDQAALQAGKIKPLSAQQRYNEQEQTTRALLRGSR